MLARYRVRALHEFAYDGARSTTRRATAPQNINPNDYQKQRDRLQLLREAEDLENNFGPAKMLNRKYAMYVAPKSYHAQTGDHVLDTDVEAWLNECWFPFADITGQYDFFAMLEFGVIGMNRGGDYGWAYMRPGLEEGMSTEDAIKLPFCIQAVEPDRIGGIYQNVVSNNYVSGVVIGADGAPTHYRVFQRSMVAAQYTNPIDVPASQFVHYMDPMRHDTYRGVSKHETGITAMRDMYELFEFIKGKAKLAAALTVFTNSQGAMTGQGAMDGYNTNIEVPGGQGVMQQDILHGQINHLPQGQNIAFPESASPGEQVQWAIKQLMKFTAMGFNLPFSFALDATDLGGVSGRLESEQARAEFTRGKGVLVPKANRIKNAALLDAMAKGVFPVSQRTKIFKGRWGFLPHPQPDIGKEAQAAVSFYQNGLLDPLDFWSSTMGGDPETAADNMSRWVSIKKKAATEHGNTVEEVFGNGPIAPGTQDKSQSDKPGDGTPQPSRVQMSRMMARVPKKDWDHYIALWKAFMVAPGPDGKGYTEDEAWAATYKIIDGGTFKESRLPE